MIDDQVKESNQDKESCVLTKIDVPGEGSLYRCDIWTVDSWVRKNWCFLNVACSARKGNQSWIYIGSTDPEAETPIIWTPDVKNGLTGQGADASNNWSQEETRTTEDEMIRWHHQLEQHEFKEVLGVGDGQESMTCCRKWGVTKFELDWETELNWTQM